MQMQDYVRYSPKQVKENLEKATNLIIPVYKKMKFIKYGSLFFVACGSSYNSTLMSLPFWRRNSNKPVYLLTPEDINKEKYNKKLNPLFLVISQSGSSTNILSCLKQLKKDKANVIVLTGNIDSPVKGYSSLIYNYGAGNEYVDFVTQGVHTLYEFLLLLSFKIFKKENFDNMISDADSIYKAQLTVLTNTQNFINQNKISLSSQGPIIFCGDKYNFGVAKEFALKSSETLKRAGMYFEHEEFLHGPDMQLNPDYTIFLLDDSPSNSRIIQIYKSLRRISNHVYLITTNPVLSKQRNVINIPKPKKEEYLVFEDLLTFQLICSELSDVLDTWPVHPFLSELRNKLQTKSSNYKKEINQIKQKWETGHAK